jgi:hypothetical protein
MYVSPGHAVVSPMRMTQKRGGNGDAGVGTQSWSMLHVPRAGTDAGVHARTTSDHAMGDSAGLPPLGAQAAGPVGIGESMLNDAPHEGGFTQADAVSGCGPAHAVAQLPSEKNVSVAGVHMVPWGAAQLHAEQAAGEASIPRLPSKAGVLA